MGSFLCRINPLIPPSYKIKQDNLSHVRRIEKAFLPFYLNRHSCLATKADIAFNEYHKHRDSAQTFIIFT